MEATMSDLKLVDLRSVDAEAEEAARTKALVDFYTARMERHLAEERAAKARLVWSHELSLGAETVHIERRISRLIEREREGLALVEIRALGEWHARQAELHAEAAGWCQSKVGVLRPTLARGRP
jgi:hypothetical protein